MRDTSHWFVYKMIEILRIRIVRKPTVRKPTATFPFTFVFMFTIHVQEPKMGRRARGVALPHPFYGCGHKMEGGCLNGSLD